MKISSTRKILAWSCPLNHNLPNHFFVSPIVNSCSRSKEMFQFSTYIMPLDEVSHHKYTNYEGIVAIQIILLHNTLIKKELKACVQSFSFFHQMIALKVDSHLSIKFVLFTSFWSCRKSGLINCILLNNPKQPLHAKNCFKNKIFWKRIIKKP